MIKISQETKQYLKELASKNNKPPLFIFTLEKSGCAGMSHKLNYTTFLELNIKQQDSPLSIFDIENSTFHTTLTNDIKEYVEHNNLCLVVENKDLDLLKDTEINLQSYGLSKTIEFNSPLIKSACSCGKSVSF